MFQKYATFQVLSTVLVPADATGPQMQRLAHRHDFKYSVRPGYLYVRSRAISSRCNDNFDEFPAEEIKKAFATFIGKPVFVNHSNENHRRARGVVIDAALHEDRNPDGSPDTWVEALMEVDAVRFPRLAKAILAGHIDRTSMGTDVAYSLCSACGNRATSPSEYCQHIPRMKGQRIYRHNAKTGKQEGILIREKCFGLGFFENSLLVEEPADPTAYVIGVDSSGLEKAASRKTAANTEPIDLLLQHWDQGASDTAGGFNQQRRDDALSQLRDLHQQGHTHAQYTHDYATGKPSWKPVHPSTGTVPIEDAISDYAHRAGQGAGDATGIYSPEGMAQVYHPRVKALIDLQNQGFTHARWGRDYEGDEVNKWHGSMPSAGPTKWSSKQATWIGDSPDEPTLFWRSPNMRHEVHIKNEMPSRDFRENYGVKPTQDVSLHEHDLEALKRGDKSRPAIRHIDSRDGELGPSQFGDSRKPPAHVMKQVRKAVDQVAQNAENHADLYGQQAEQSDMEADQRRVPKDMEDEEKGRRMVDHAINSAGPLDQWEQDVHKQEQERKRKQMGSDAAESWSRDTYGDKGMDMANYLLSQQPTGPTKWSRKTANFDVHFNDDDMNFFRQMHEQGQRSKEMIEHNKKRVVDLSDPADLRSHMHETHQWTDDDMWRNSHPQDHPAMMGGNDDDRPLTHSELRGAHDHEHTTEYPEDYQGATTLDDSHFHTASKREPMRDVLEYTDFTKTAAEGGAADEGYRGNMPADAPPNAVGYEPHDKEYWVKCKQGHTHYGAGGAAGLLMGHTDDEGTKRFYLQKRAPWVDHGNTYSVPGGAVHHGESPEDGAKREASEELGQLPEMKHVKTHSDDHGDWGYHTVETSVKDRSNFGGDDYEHAGGGWFTHGEIKKLPLHPGFASTWDRIGGQASGEKTSMLTVLANIWKHGAVGSFNEAKDAYENYRGSKSHVPIANNTWIHQDDQGNHHVRYHNTDIVSFSPEGNITVNRAGWDTNTTNSRINSLLPGGARIGRNPSRARGAPHSVLTLHGETHPYHDGISFNHHTGEILPDDHVRPSGVTVRPPQARGSGNGSPRARTRSDSPGGFYSPYIHSTPTGESADAPFSRNIGTEPGATYHSPFGQGRGEPGANYDPERDRREISNQERQTPGSDSYDSGMSWSPPKHEVGGDEGPREGEDFASWMDRTTPASTATKCKRCSGKGQIYTGTDMKRQDCPSCKGTGTIGTTAARHRDLEELSRVYLEGLRRLAAGSKRYFAEHPSGYRAEWTGGPRFHIYEGDNPVDSPPIKGYSDAMRSSEVEDNANKYTQGHMEKQLHDWVGESGDDYTRFNHPEIEPMSYADRARFKNLDARGSKVAFGETVAPSDVDTLRDEECPVCGESSSSFDGKTCQVCGYDAPPTMFRDPDLEKAKSLDLRKDEADEGLGLQPGPEGLTPGQQDANGGMPGEVPGSEEPGSDQPPMDPSMLDENGQPIQGEQMGEEQPIDPAQIVQQQMEQLQTGVPLTPDELGPQGEIIPQDVDQEGINPDDNPAGEPGAIDPNALDEEGNPIPPQEQGGEQQPVDPNALDENGEPMPDTGQEPSLRPGEGDPGTPEDGVPDLVCPACGFETDAAQPMSTDMDTQAVPEPGEGDGTMAGDVCPNCGQAALISVGEMEQMQQQGAPVQAALNATKGRRDLRGNSRESRASEGVNSMTRPLMAAVAAQQKQINQMARENAVLRLQLGYVAQLAGVSKQVEAIRKRADIENPAQPVDNPPSEGPFETTEQAVQPEAYDDVRNPGITPGSVGGVPAETTDVALNPGETLPTSPFNQLDNVQAPISGTETQLPLNQTRIETDVRVGDPMNPQVAYPWDISPNQSNASKHAASKGNRTIASIQLARLQIEAGLSQETNDLSLGAQIEASKVSDDEIASTIRTLAGVRKAASRQGQRPAGLVPRSASVRRTTPSLAGDAPLQAVAAVNGDDTADADLFLD